MQRYRVILETRPEVAAGDAEEAVMRALKQPFRAADSWPIAIFAPDFQELHDAFAATEMSSDVADRWEVAVCCEVEVDAHHPAEAALAAQSRLAEPGAPEARELFARMAQPARSARQPVSLTPPARELERLF
ncbi:hypothetical protein CKO28_00215 [Rhodovibrio sodomensis]|uniref:Uncharacterized protein n=1 Tax=Rhodovibrio sodomensis TaxID=1088 RepID=A0ABS1D7R3_9PROT|nr:hypothetical protein [Rhodovibrio sodomensis]MBK1666463.1 hypothetical protein [Rhodovibrio sodomensis]